MTGKFREPLKRLLRQLEDALRDLEGLDDALKGREEAIRERERLAEHRHLEKSLEDALYERQLLEDALIKALVWMAKESGSVDGAMAEIERSNATLVGSRLWERVVGRVNRAWAAGLPWRGSD